MVLEIVIGAIVGPQILGGVHPAITMNFLANSGLAMLFLAAGFEMDPNVPNGTRIRNAVAGWFASAVLALVVAPLLTDARLASGLTLTALDIPEFLRNSGES